MRKQLFLILFGLLAVVTVQAQFAKPLKKKTAQEKVFSLGLTGSYAANDMVYSAVTKSKMVPMFAPSLGLVAEWNTMSRFSVGADVSYVTRGDKVAFATEFLTSYSTTTFARVDYGITLKGIELRVPFIWYFGDGALLKPYVYVAPRVCLWTNGRYCWERTYDNYDLPPLIFEGEITRAMIRPFDLGAIAGIGFCSRLKTRLMHLFVKFDLGYGANAINSFSQGEINEMVMFQGWGDIGQEKLGQRHLQNVEARLTLLVPFQKPAADACDFDQKPYKR